ncbi:hypothetical protein Taro_014476 [Colocasia esculenta]|uniref:Uncharacterized protein n=1 Tax=Colocasia esculenta TaxID=4460 RepID=A0A843UIW2_COLES|nr:hypothetical protein [Colocasia esculenta]
MSRIHPPPPQLPGLPLEAPSTFKQKSFISRIQRTSSEGKAKRWDLCVERGVHLESPFLFLFRLVMNDPKHSWRWQLGVANGVICITQYRSWRRPCNKSYRVELVSG